MTWIITKEMLEADRYGDPWHWRKQVKELRPFVVQNNDSKEGFLNVEGDYAFWVAFESATVFTNINDLINFVIRAVLDRPSNWRNNIRFWALKEVEPIPPTPPNYRLTGRTL